MLSPAAISSARCGELAEPPASFASPAGAPVSARRAASASARTPPSGRAARPPSSARPAPAAAPRRSARWTALISSIALVHLGRHRLEMVLLPVLAADRVGVAVDADGHLRHHVVLVSAASISLVGQRGPTSAMMRRAARPASDPRRFVSPPGPRARGFLRRRAASAMRSSAASSRSAALIGVFDFRVHRLAVPLAPELELRRAAGLKVKHDVHPAVSCTDWRRRVRRSRRACPSRCSRRRGPALYAGCLWWRELVAGRAGRIPARDVDRHPGLRRCAGAARWPRCGSGSGRSCSARLPRLRPGRGRRRDARRRCAGRAARRRSISASQAPRGGLLALARTASAGDRREPVG